MYAAEIQKAIDDYMEMERKAKAWDELLARIQEGQGPLDFIVSIVHPAQDSPKE